MQCGELYLSLIELSFIISFNSEDIVFVSVCSTHRVQRFSLNMDHSRGTLKKSKAWECGSMIWFLISKQWPVKKLEVLLIFYTLVVLILDTKVISVRTPLKVCNLPIWETKLSKLLKTSNRHYFLLGWDKKF